MNYQDQVTYYSLKNKIVVITGGASGIGEALVRAFVSQQSKVILMDYNADAGQALAQALDCHFIFADVTDMPSFLNGFNEIQMQFGHIDVLINNAGSDDHHPIQEITEAYFEDRMNVNLRHYLFAIQAVIEGMATNGGGSIINMGSVNWMRGRPGRVLYSAAKAAIHGMTRTLARELGEKNIRVNSLVPGAIRTPKQDAMWANLDPMAVNEFVALQALKFRLDGSHCARMALFLASDESNGCTGQDFIVDAGLTLN